jgi:hypothetical protein
VCREAQKAYLLVSFNLEKKYRLNIEPSKIKRITVKKRTSKERVAAPKK